MFRAAPQPARVRLPAAAGRFYPAEAEALRREVAEHLHRAGAVVEPAPKAVIAPHAGYLYSGPVAGCAFAPGKLWSDRVRRVVVVGPSHFESFDGLAVSMAEAFATPLGEMAIDRAAVEKLVRLRLVRVHEPAHQADHALEVELPFLQTLLPEATLVPILTGQSNGEQVGEVLNLLWGGEETVIVISSDLSHYLDYDRAREVDAETRAAVEALDPAPVDAYHACGHLPIQGLLQAARVRGLRPVTMDLRNSGDTSGRRDRVVGYGAWVFEPMPNPAHPDPSANPVH